MEPEASLGRCSVARLAAHAGSVEETHDLRRLEAGGGTNVQRQTFHTVCHCTTTQAGRRRPLKGPVRHGAACLCSPSYGRTSLPVQYETRRRGANTAHIHMGRPTHEAPTREYTHKHTQTQTNTKYGADSRRGAALLRRGGRLAPTPSELHLCRDLPRRSYVHRHREAL